MARNITVTFADGTTHVYQNAPDNITPDMVQERATKEFGKQITHLDGGKTPSSSPTAAAPPANATAPKAQPKQSPQYLKALNEARYLADQTNGLGCLEAIISKAKLYLNPKGLIAVEHGFDQSDAVINLMRTAGFSDIQTYLDLAGHHRVASGRK